MKGTCRDEGWHLNTSERAAAYEIGALRTLGFIMMELMQKYSKDDEAVVIGFSETTSAASAGDLLRVSHAPSQKTRSDISSIHF